MDTQEIRTLQILEKIDGHCAMSQRDLARDLNISLGLVNAFFKRLLHKGYVKATTVPRNRMRYIITPQGLVEKSRLTYDYIRFSCRYFRDTRQKLRAIFRDLETAGVRRVAFYGATDLAEIAYLSLQETSIELAAIADGRRSGLRLLGRTVLDREGLAATAFDRLVVTDDGQRERALENILTVPVASDRIVFIE